MRRGLSCCDVGMACIISSAQRGLKILNAKRNYDHKKSDNSSPKMMESSKKHSSSLRGNNSNDRKGGRNLGQ
jgi:hypothetical protein